MKKIFLQLVFIFFLSFFTSCEREEFEISNESPQNQSDYQVKKISFSELKLNRTAFEKLKESRSKISPSYIQRGVYNEDFGVFIDTTNILITEKDGKHSITFRIINEEELSKIENLVLNSKEDGSYKAFITEYLLSQEELIKLANNEDIGDKKPSAITDMSSYARFSIDGNGADCLTVISFFVESCRNSQGDIIPTDSDLGDGCVGMSFPVEHKIMVIDAGCLSGGGGGNYSGGDNSGYNPGGGNWSGGGGGSPADGNPGNPNTGNPNTGNPNTGGNNNGNDPNPNYDLTDGSGNPIITTPILTNGRIHHIEELHKITTQNEYGTNGLRNYINQLASNTDDPIEQGMEFKLNTNGSFSAYPAESNGIDGTGFPPVSVNNPIIRMHKHHTGLNPIFSAEDVLGMVDFFIQKNNFNPNPSQNNNITFIMVSEDGVHALRVSNPTEIMEFNSYYSNSENKRAFVNAYHLQVVVESRKQCDGTCSDNEFKDFLFQNFVKFIQKMVWGIDFYYAPHPENYNDNYNWTKQN